ncbi:hybrid sensor histidine kinase/response regulator transcription factor [Mangrovibacterium lignilyticum]|uniref:hybrid sensor histidine kinase/response regulator transcription factor n=1 Tax=Mangrovibacterium lignilyticum TaxID=2668052 RepID=UPI0013D1FFD7|nr:two-component regulator propeller domain-containing protein [Mangrovibacterium lignilyticum]
MKKILSLLFLVFISAFSSSVRAVEVEHFEVLNTNDGLSQNSVQSIFCDSRGYMWFGTMDGLNRYDGYEFKIYKTQYNNPFSLTNNRIVNIWEDKRGLIWLASHDGHYHYLDLRTEKFYSFPPTTEPGNPRNTKITSFLELDNEIWLGSNNAGIYRLTAPGNEQGTYEFSVIEKGTDRGISDSMVNFILADRDSGIWIGTKAGLNFYNRDSYSGDQLKSPQVFSKGVNITCGVANERHLYFGSQMSGLVRMDLQQEKMEPLPVEGLNDVVTLVKLSDTGKLIVGTKSSGLFVCEENGKLIRHYMDGQTIVDVFEASNGSFWVTTDDFGITRITSDFEKAVFYELVPRDIQTLVDLQRQYLFEDRDSNLWVATHGGGLGVYDEESDSFRFYRNDPNDPNSLSSDIAYCVAQDHSGLIWVGTGQFNAGVNKAIPANPMFRQLKVEKQVTSLTDNVIRAIRQDNRENVWLATKSGRLYIYNTEFELVHKYDGIPTEHGRLRRFNVYTILQDEQGYIWLGSKGGGLARSRRPLQNYRNYNELSFHIYRHEEGNKQSLSNDYIYSITQDQEGRILVGAYGSGIDVIDNPSSEHLRFTNISTENSNLSSNEVRYILEDLGGTIWVATTFGLNELVSSITDPNPQFNTYFYDVNYDRSLSYNDLIYLYEDETHRMWLGTFGGGLNRIMQNSDDEVIFSHESKQEGLINDAVFGILEGDKGDLWLSTENGISRYNIQSREFENYDTNNGLMCSNFSEGTCYKLKDGRLLFGTLDGLLIVTENEVTKQNFQPPVVFTSFSLFNQEVDYKDDNSPLKAHINFTNDIVLKYDQSSFSIEYAALSYFDPLKNQYSYTLEGFDNRWYDVRNERKASYTNLSPGEYTFKVKAANWDGTWSDTPKSLHITILPPWWRTNLAYIIYFILAILVFEVSRRIFVKYNRLSTDLKVERKVNEIKLKFFTNISHEIRTPLTLVLGPLEDLKRMSNLPDSVKHPIEMMSSNGKRMLRLINQLLDFRKVQNQKMKLKLSEVDLVAFVREIGQNFDQLAEQRHIQFELPDNLESVNVWIDQEKMDSVLFNLLSNAFKFTPEGKRISVRIETDGKAKEVRILVEDEGKGIAKNKMPMLFQRFTALSDENSEYSGSGIGLAYSFELMKLHRGNIEVQSTEGQGSIFTVSLKQGNRHFTAGELNYKPADQTRPVSHSEELEENVQLSSEQSDDSQIATQKYTVLLVEDQADIRQYIASFLNGSFKIIHASNGEEGLQLVREKHPDLVVTDLMMPVMDGIQMTREIKQDFELSHIPVVMLTAKSAVDSQIEGIESGAEAYVIKPFNSEYLISVVQNLLRQRQNVLDYVSKNNPFQGNIKITNKDEEFLKSLVNLITDNCQDSDFNVDALVKETALGRTVFYNKVKTLTGMSPVEFLRNTKLQIAAQYLSSGGYNVSEAAYLSGFNDLKYFSKKFKERYQVPPSQYGKA